MSSLGPRSALSGHPRRTTRTAPKAQEGTVDTSIQSLGSRPGILLLPALPCLFSCLSTSCNREWRERGGAGQCQKGSLGKHLDGCTQPRPSLLYPALRFYPQDNG